MNLGNTHLTRRAFMKAAGLSAVSLAALACAPVPSAAPAAEAPAAGAAAPAGVTGGPLEVGVFYEEGAWFEMTKALGDQMQIDIPGTEIKLVTRQFEGIGQ